MNPKVSPGSSAPVVWTGSGSTTNLPPPEYWTHLANVMPGPQLERLKEQSNQRLTEFTSRALPPPESTAFDLLNRFASDGWVEREQRHICPRCTHDLNNEEIAGAACPYCGESNSEDHGVTRETIFIRHLAQPRSVDWLVAIHGMNTSGAWQEAFTWNFSTTWGRSVPVAVYKYGIVIAGVIMAGRRRKLQRDLHTKLVALRDQARAQGLDGNPDVIAHSFGTWLFGHLLKDELTRDPADRLRFGRVIFAGCILRPDFDWKAIKEAGLVQNVLNHYGTADCVVPLAHAVIKDSGPSGRRGFDGDKVVNIQAAGFGHSDLFSIEKYVASGITCLASSYQRYWRPFLTLPDHELSNLPDRMDPQIPWQQFPWPTRGTIFPFLALPLVLAIMSLFVAGVGRYLWDWREILLNVAKITGTSLGLILISIAITCLWRWLRS
jgi:hypothetical protein